MSLENATIVNSCSRWPLMIDPQLQGTNWLKGFYQELQDKEEEEKQKNSNQNIGGDDEEMPSINELL